MLGLIVAGVSPDRVVVALLPLKIPRTLSIDLIHMLSPRVLCVTNLSNKTGLVSELFHHTYHSSLTKTTQKASY